jgi:hypothetical protein
MRNSDLDFLVVAFAFLCGAVLGYMAGTPIDCTHAKQAYEQPLPEILPTMGQD